MKELRNDLKGELFIEIFSFMSHVQFFGLVEMIFLKYLQEVGEKKPFYLFIFFGKKPFYKESSDVKGNHRFLSQTEFRYDSVAVNGGLIP